MQVTPTPATAAQLRIVLSRFHAPDTSADDEFRAFMTQMTGIGEAP